MGLSITKVGLIAIVIALNRITQDDYSCRYFYIRTTGILPGEKTFLANDIYPRFFVFITLNVPQTTIKTNIIPMKTIPFVCSALFANISSG